MMSETNKGSGSIINRLTMMVTGILCIAALVAGSLALAGQQRQLKRALGTKASTLAQFMAQVTPIDILSLNFVEMNNNVKKVVLTDEEAVYAVILNEQGIPLVSFFKDADPLVSSEVRGLLKSRKTPAAIEALKSSGRILEVTAPIAAGEKRIGSALLGFSSDKMRRALLMQTAVIGAVLIVIISASIAMLRVVLRRILQPVRTLTAAATQISTGDLNVHVSGTDRFDELGILSRAFESMASRVRGLISGLESREHDLHQLNLFQRTILDNAAYGIISADPEGTVSSFNRAAERLLGRPAGEVVGKLTPVSWHDQDEVARAARRLSDELGETVAPGFEVFAARPRRNLPEEREWTFIRKDGTRVPVLLSVSALRGENGRITGFVGMTYDLTERKRAEKALQESEAKYRIVADNTYDWEFWQAPDGHFVYLSPSFERITGYGAREFLSDSSLLRRITHPDDLERYDRHLSEHHQEHTVGEMEYRLIRPDGAVRWIDHVCQPLFDGEGNYLGVRGSNRDSTERKLAEDELRRLKDELEQRVRERTAELEEKNRELERLNKVFVGRELRMAELKDKIRELERHGP